MLSAFQLSILKLGMGRIRNIDKMSAKQALVKGMLLTGQLIGKRAVAEGVESKAEKPI